MLLAFWINGQMSNMRDIKPRSPLCRVVLSVVLLLIATPAFAFTSQQLFERYGDKVVQVRILDRSSGLKAGFGSGFVVADKLVATNYHVVADLLMRPEDFRAEYHQRDGHSGPLQLVSVDVINDLALLAPDGIQGEPLELARRTLKQGERVHALGNPFDLGLTIVDGTYNGLQEKSLYERIHYTGSINPGMSGGPALDSRGRVIGINVATAGNQVSFLVPVSRLQELLDAGRDLVEPEQQLQEIRRQLLENQDRYFGELLAAPFERVTLGEFTLPGELASYVHCWGSSRKGEEQLYEVSYQACATQDELYLSDELSTGTIAFRHELYRAGELDAFRFYNLLERHAQQVAFGFGGEEEDLGRFACSTELLEIEPMSLKAVVCLRGYQRFEGLYDLYLSAFSVHQSEQSLHTSLSLTGVSYANARAFLAAYLESLSWQPSP